MRRQGARQKWFPKDEVVRQVVIGPRATQAMLRGRAVTITLRIARAGHTTVVRRRLRLS